MSKFTIFDQNLPAHERLEVTRAPQPDSPKNVLAIFKARTPKSPIRSRPPMNLTRHDCGPIMTTINNSPDKVVIKISQKTIEQPQKMMTTPQKMPSPMKVSPTKTSPTKATPTKATPTKTTPKKQPEVKFVARKKAWIQFKDLPRTPAISEFELKLEIEVQQVEEALLGELRQIFFEKPEDFKHYLFQYYDSICDDRLRKMTAVRNAAMDHMEKERTKMILAKLAEKQAERAAEAMRKFNEGTF